MRKVYVFSESTELRPLLSSGSVLPFTGLGFDLQTVTLRPLTLRCWLIQDCDILPVEQDIPVLAGRVLLTRLKREIRGR